MSVIDGRSLPKGELIESDLCIVGGGAAGIAIALEFANTDVANFVVNQYVTEIKETYKKHQQVIAYLEDVCRDVVVNSSNFIDGEPFGRGTGSSKKTAEQDAAADALSNWARLDPPEGRS